MELFANVKFNIVVLLNRSVLHVLSSEATCCCYLHQQVLSSGEFVGWLFVRSFMTLVICQKCSSLIFMQFHYLTQMLSIYAKCCY